MRLKAFIKVYKAKIICICLRSNRGCGCEDCEKAELTYNQYKGIRECFKQDRYGK